MKSVKFIHGADIHLDSPMIGLQSLPQNIFNRLQNSTFKAFSTLIDAAIEHQVDFVILAGDLFDNEDRSVRAQVFLKKELERLEKEGIAVFLVHGNHDHLSGKWNQIKLPSNVYVFGNEVEGTVYTTKQNYIIHLYGFSYREKHIYERKIDDYKKMAGADFHIGILHGNLEGDGEHDNYAPFKLKDLTEKNFHYWALGHIHKRAILKESPPIVYSGNTQGRHKKETGMKGCYFVTLTEAGSQLQFLETSDVIWTELKIDAESVHTFDDLYQLCTNQIESIREVEKGMLANIEILHLPEDISTAATEELLETLQEEEEKELAFVWPISLQIEERVHWKREELAEDSDFYGELFDVIDQFDRVEETLAALYKHHSGRKYLSTLTNKEVNELQKKGEQLLMEHLLRGR